MFVIENFSLDTPKLLSVLESVVQRIEGITTHVLTAEADFMPHLVKKEYIAPRNVCLRIRM